MITEEMVSETERARALYNEIRESTGEIARCVRPFDGAFLLCNPEIDMIGDRLRDLNRLWDEYAALNMKAKGRRDALEAPTTDNDPKPE